MLAGALILTCKLHIFGLTQLTLESKTGNLERSIEGVNQVL
jgi:hypothetical protein